VSACEPTIQQLDSESDKEKQPPFAIFEEIVHFLELACLSESYSYSSRAMPLDLRHTPVDEQFDTCDVAARDILGPASLARFVH